MNIEIETTCRRCDRLWTPDHSDYVRGRWRVCPRCRDDPAIPEGSGGKRTERISGEHRGGKDR